MRSPFPGMDPYLENPTLWPGLHDKIIYNLVEALNGVPPESYVADMQQRLYVSHTDGQIIPDVVTQKQSTTNAPARAAGGTALLARVATPAILIALPEEIAESYVNIVHLGTERQIVTVIEVLIPSNKTSGSEGRDSYLQKQK